jgi:putative endonuclease
MRSYYVYILTNRSGTSYVGVTNDLVRRVFDHRKASPKTFTGRYKIDRLVYFEEGTSAYDAIAGDKQIKGWTRQRKIELINEMNPRWEDLSAEWVEDEARPLLAP